MAIINRSFEIKEIKVDRGETFTIWLQTEKEKFLQVELRVTDSGEPEIFTHTDKIILKDFMNWKPLAKIQP